MRAVVAAFVQLKMDDASLLVPAGVVPTPAAILKTHIQSNHGSSTRDERRTKLIQFVLNEGKSHSAVLNPASPEANGIRTTQKQELAEKSMLPLPECKCNAGEQRADDARQIELDRVEGNRVRQVILGYK
jgi:hypothetical protein